MVTEGMILSNRYLIEEEIGSGGMSTVYRAVDLRTGAHVAIKIPHAFLLRDEQFVQRLNREARISATIQSSRVARVTDVSAHEGTPYFVMEYVEGETLAALIGREGALPAGRAVPIMLEVARALVAAQAAGVVHRDLKPHNIYLTPDGDVKVIDFGIAREQNVPALTSASLFIGTPDYAAPERIDGVSDIRSDIYSAGIVLHEALTGSLPFGGSTPWVVMQRHASQPPPPLAADVPEAVRLIVERCLAKRPEERYQTPRELADALGLALRGLDRESGTPARSAVGPTRMVGLAAADTNGDSVSGYAVAPPAVPPVSEPDAPEAGPAEPGLPAAETVTPGPPVAESVMAWPARVEDRPAPASDRPRRPRSRLPLIAGGLAALAVLLVAAFFLLRPDGSGGDAGEVATENEAPRTDAEREAALRVLEPAEGATLSGPIRVAVDTSAINLKAPVEGDPRGRHIHYFLDIDPATVLAPGQPIPTGNQSIIHTANLSHTFVNLPPGTHTVWAVLTGNDHVPLSLRQSGRVRFTTLPDPLVSARTGEDSLVLYQAFVDGKWRIFVMDGRGENPRRLTGGNANFYNPSWSPDGSRIALQSDRDGGSQIYSINPDGSDMTKLTDGPFNNRSAAWSPDGKEIVFVSDRDGRDHLWAVAPTGGEPRQITRGATTDGAPHWSPDGARIVYQSERGPTTHLFVVDAKGAGTPRQLTDGPERNNRPVWSPDGKRIAFASFRENAWNIYIMDADGSNLRRITESAFNINPSWAPDGKQIIFQSDRDGGQQQIFVVAAEGGEVRRLSKGEVISASPSWPRK